MPADTVTPDDLRAFEKLLACGVPVTIKTAHLPGDQFWFVELKRDLGTSVYAACGATLADAAFAALDRLRSGKEANADDVGDFIELHGLRRLNPWNEIPPRFAIDTAGELDECGFIRLCHESGVDCLDVMKAIRSHGS